MLRGFRSFRRRVYFTRSVVAVMLLSQLAATAGLPAPARGTPTAEAGAKLCPCHGGVCCCPPSEHAHPCCLPETLPPPGPESCCPAEPAPATAIDEEPTSACCQAAKPPPPKPAAAAAPSGGIRFVPGFYAQHCRGPDLPGLSPFHAIPVPVRAVWRWEEVPAAWLRPPGQYASPLPFRPPVPPPR